MRNSTCASGTIEDDAPPNASVDGCRQGQPEATEPLGKPTPSGSGDQPVPDTDSGSCDGGTKEPFGGAQGGEAANRDSDIDWGKYEAAIRRWEYVTGRVAPAPTEFGARGNIRLSSRFAEWMMGVPPGWITGMGFARKHEFRLIGNGVVPLQAALAIRGLINEER